MSITYTLNEHIMPRHIAIIMDGNGRWAKQRGKPRLVGHRAGTENIRNIVTTCADMGIECLTLYAFSTENWNRPSFEVEGLMKILSDFIDRETANLHAEGVRLRHLGQLEGINQTLKRKVHYALDLTRNNTRLTLCIAFNYGGRADIVRAARALVAKGIPPEEITEELFAFHLTTSGLPDPDMVIRTSGEWRLSNFLTWETAYSLYWSTPTLWPDFNTNQLIEAIAAYSAYEQRLAAPVSHEVYAATALAR